LIAPGKLPDDILKDGAATMRPRWETWPFSKDIYRAAAAKTLESKRPLSHGVGMPVHEPENYFGRPLEPGTVFALDPEIFIPEERLYFRCEDTLVVTESGCDNLTSAAPLEMDEVERAKKEE
jgi:Xaa-Pro aminopeptidase